MAVAELPSRGARSSGPTAQDVIAKDLIEAPATLRMESQYDLGTSDIPVERYFSRDWHDLEVDRVWKRVWQLACREDDLPTVGDTQVYEVADMSVLLVRSATDRIEAFHNACLHRGTQLRNKGGYTPELRCPFHGWTWDLSGRLQTIPCEWDFPQLHKASLDLPSLQVGTWGGWVFVNPDLHAPSLVEFLGTMPEQFVWDTSRRYKSVHVEKLLRCNWKTCMEAFMESYHVIATHPQILSYLADANTQYDVFPGAGPGRPGWNRMNTLAGVPSPHLGDGVPDSDVLAAQLAYYQLEPPEIPEGRSARHVLAEMFRAGKTTPASLPGPRISDSELLDNILYWVFPNFQPWGGLNPINYRFRPYGNDPDACIMDVMLLLDPEGDEKPPSAPVRRLGFDDPWTDVEELGTLAMVFQQDSGNLPRVQRGLHATRKPGVSLGLYQESRIRQFHSELTQWVQGDS